KNGVAEIGIVVVDDKTRPVSEFQQFIKPYPRPYPEQDRFVSYEPDAVAIHGLSFEYLMTNGKLVQQGVNEMREFCAKHAVHTLIGHNLPAFDVPRVNYLIGAFARDKTPLDGLRAVCTLKASRDRWPRLKSHKLEDLCAHFNLPHNDKHR